MSTPFNADPIDVAASYPDPPDVQVADGHTTGPPVAAALVERLDATPGGPVEVVLSAEQLTAGTEWTVSGAVRFRRRIVSSTRTVEMTVRREEIQVEVRDVAERNGAWVGSEYRGPAVTPPPVVTGPGVFVLREEVPEVVLSIRPLRAGGRGGRPGGRARPCRRDCTTRAGHPQRRHRRATPTPSPLTAARTRLGRSPRRCPENLFRSGAIFVAQPGSY